MLRLLGVLAACAALAQAGNTDLFRAIRNGDTATVHKLLKAGASPNAKDATGATALMHAALYAGADTVKVLLDAKADPNAANEAGATALLWAVPDEPKVRLLAERGARVDARSHEGVTALMIAARCNGSAPLVRYLLSKGADPKAADAMGGTALMRAAQAGNTEVVRLLIERGADVNTQPPPGFALPRFGRPPKFPADAKGVTPLVLAAAGGNAETVRLLLDHGADPHAKALGSVTPLAAAAWRNEPEMIKLLLAKGADPNAREFRGASPLIVAAASDEPGPEVARLLLAKGADPAVKDAMGRTAADFKALRQGENGRAPAAARRDVRTAVNASIALLQSAGAGFLKQSGCISCHHQSIPQMAIGAARARGFQVNETLARESRDAVASVMGLHRETSLQSIATIPASTLVSSYALIGLAAEGHPADAATDALVHELALRQKQDGRWKLTTAFENSRPPLDQGDITNTALTMRAIQLYAWPGRKAEFDARIAKAREWLAAQTPRTTQEKNMRLLGLAWTKADRALVHAAAEQILDEQRDDGGWAQLDTLGSDAYATGQALAALYESGVVRPADPAYRRGVRFLLATQGERGDWHVRSRALGFQPYFESGYPHGHDQWISSAGAAWATLALALTEEPVSTVARR